MNQSPSPKNEILEAALLYLEMGFSVIPVGKDKRPTTQWKSYQERMATKTEIEYLFNNEKVEGVGIVTGAISGIVVVDIEKDGKYDDLPPSTCVKTGGGGIHIYYAYDPKKPINNFTRIRELTDIRGDGGYVIAPPSNHPSGGIYEWITEFDRDKLQAFPYALIEAYQEGKSLTTDQKQVALDEVAQKGSRNDQAARVAGKLLRDISPALWGSAGWLTLKEWNHQKCDPPLNEKELRKVWESIKKTHKKAEKKSSKSSKKEEDVIEIYSKILPDGTFVETYYDQTSEKTGFFVCEKGKVTKKAYIKVGEKTYMPPPPDNNLVSGQFVKLPSDIDSFDSEQGLIDEIKAFIHEYVEVSPAFEEIASFYVLFSWVYDAFHELPYLRVLGDYGTGKSRMIKVVGALGYKSIFLNGATSISSIFRMINEVKGMIVLDEADFRHSDTNHELVKILNSGFQKGMPVFRSEAKVSGKNKTFDPTPFDVFCPKVLATRRNFQDEALESRSLTYAMQAAKREDIPENLDDEFEKKALKIRNKLLAFRFKLLSEGIKKRSLPKIPIEPRLRQIITPLYSIVSESAAQQLIIRFIQKKQGDVYESRFNSQEGQLFRSILMLLKENKEPTMGEITEKYNNEFAGRYAIKARKAGEIVGQILHLDKNNGSRGIYLVDSKSNTQQIEKLKKKFGVDKKMDVVNIVNVDKEVAKRMIKDAEEVFGAKSKPKNEELPF